MQSSRSLYQQMAERDAEFYEQLKSAGFSSTGATTDRACL